MVWEKDSFANPLLCNKAPVSYYEDVLAFFKKYDTLAQHPLRDYAKTVLKHCGGTHSEVNKRLGHRRSEHFFYINSTQFGLCTSDAYNELCEVFLINKEVWFKSYPELHDTHRRFNRRFNLQDGKKYKSNILKYKKDYTGYHPTQSRFCYLKI
jgi:site-specific DNA-methyltransferase (adenine-specific)